MYYLYICLLIYGILRSAVSNCSILNSVYVLKKKYKDLKITKTTNLKRNYFILIPLLREQEKIQDLLKTFGDLEGKYKLVFITTHREQVEHEQNRKEFKSRIAENLLRCTSLNSFLELSIGFFYESYARTVYKKLKNIPDHQKINFLLQMYDKKPLTGDVLKEELQKFQAENILILEYPNSNGVMAHQLNYACEYIRKKYPNGNNVVCIYNADSVIQKNFISTLKKLPANVVQQSSTFLKNYQRQSSSIRETFLKGNGMLQTRWTLAHEIPRIYSQRKSNPLNFLELSHVVGHGLIINLDTLKRVGGFPTQFSNEDLPLGYMLRVNNEFVDIYPSLENSESPSTIKNVFTQYRTWFYGVAYYPQYCLYALNNYCLPLKYKFYAIFWALRGIIRSIQWLLTSVYWIFILLYPLCVWNLQLLLIAFASFLFYSVCSWYLTFMSIRKSPEVFPDQGSLKMGAFDWIAVFPVYLTHSWGLILGAFDILKSLLTRTNIKKKKTER